MADICIIFFSTVGALSTHGITLAAPQVATGIWEQKIQEHGRTCVLSSRRLIKRQQREPEGPACARDPGWELFRCGRGSSREAGLGGGFQGQVSLASGLFEGIIPSTTTKGAL